VLRGQDTEETEKAPRIGKISGLCRKKLILKLKEGEGNCYLRGYTAISFWGATDSGTSEAGERGSRGGTSEKLGSMGFPYEVLKGRHSPRGEVLLIALSRRIKNQHKSPKKPMSTGGGGGVKESEGGGETQGKKQRMDRKKSINFGGGPTNLHRKGLTRGGGRILSERGRAEDGKETIELGKCVKNKWSNKEGNDNP